MISQKCPKCGSTRIRRGYRPTSLLSKLIFRFNLLCDNCNWEFKGFALPGFKSPKQTKSSRQRQELGKNVTIQAPQPQADTAHQNASKDKRSENESLKIKKKIRIRI